MRYSERRRAYWKRNPKGIFFFLLFIFLKIMYFTYWKCREKDMQGDKDKDLLPLPYFPNASSSWGWAKESQDPGTQLGLLVWFRGGPSAWDIVYCLPRRCISRKLRSNCNQKWSWALQDGMRPSLVPSQHCAEYLACFYGIKLDRRVELILMESNKKSEF